MQAGKLRYQVTLQTKTVTRDSYGGEVITWGDAVSCWAELDPWNLKNAIALRRQQGESAIGFRLRTTDVSLGDRLNYDGDGYLIIDIDASRKHKGELLVTAKAEDNAP